MASHCASALSGALVHLPGSISFGPGNPSWPWARNCRSASASGALNAPLAEAVLQLRAQGHEGLPGPKEIEPGRWTKAPESALAQWLAIHQARPGRVGAPACRATARRRLA